MAQAIEIAAAQFVYDLPFGLDTRIGEQGMSLSGGQRQRLSLARAILAAPKILVLDDTLSALDVHTEAVVEEALRRVLHSVTGIVVAHRASTVLLADKVALLEDGTITHIGTHAELLASVPQYRYLLAADDELDDGAERSCAWQDDEDRSRLGRPTRSRRRPTRRPSQPRPLRDVGGRGPMTATDTRPIDVPEDSDAGAAASRTARSTTCRSTRSCRAAAKRGHCWARCCGRTEPPSRCSPSSSWWKTLRAFRFRSSCNAVSTTAFRRSSTAARRTR